MKARRWHRCGAPAPGGRADPGLERARSGRLGASLAAIALLAVPGCATAPPASSVPVEGDVTLIARNNLWEPDRVEVETGRDIVFVVDNRDRNVAHNLSFKKAPGAPRTKLEKGPGFQSLRVRFDAPGEYRYTCDIHALMNGTAVAR